MIDVVAFDASGSMTGEALERAVAHARESLPADTRWCASDGEELVSGRLGDGDLEERLAGIAGPPGIGEALAYVVAPGVRPIVYTDDFDDAHTFETLRGTDAVQRVVAHPGWTGDADALNVAVVGVEIEIIHPTTFN